MGDAARYFFCKKYPDQPHPAYLEEDKLELSKMIQILNRNSHISVESEEEWFGNPASL